MEKNKIWRCLGVSLLTCSLFTLLPSCQEDRTEYTSVLETEEFNTLLEATDRRIATPIVGFFHHENQGIKSLALSYAASFQNDTLISHLIDFLEQKASPDLQSLAAYALGQQGDTSERTVNTIIFAIENTKSAQLKKELLIALGKSSHQAPSKVIPILQLSACDASPMWGAYFGMLQGGNWNDAIPLAIEQLNCSQSDSRQAAAQFLARARNANLLPYAAALTKAYQEEGDNAIKMALALGLRNCPHQSVIDLINTMLLQEDDERLVMNLLRSGGRLKSIDHNALIHLLQHPGTGVSAMAADMLLAAELDAHEVAMIESLQAGVPLHAKAAFYSLLAEVSENQDTWYDALVELSATSDDPYVQSEALSKLSRFSKASSYISLHIDKNMSLPVASTAASLVIQMHQDNRYEGDFREAMKEMINTQDAGVLAILGGHLSQHPEDADDLVTLRLKSEMALLEIPKEVETYNELAKALTSITGEETETITPGFNHPVDIGILQHYGDTVNAQIVTSKGVIEIELYSLQAPGSVASFLELARTGYYNGKYFHRVVPNFVVQAGCPRGDGWGSVEYSIRSEFGLHDYNTGTLGMASAGRDTESCQWFITHSPTPHLEGRYSIFGRVIQGMEIVRLLQVGDQISQITFL